MFKVTVEKFIKETQEEQKYPRKEEVYTQLVEEINLVAIINAVNISK